MIGAFLFFAGGTRKRPGLVDVRRADRHGRVARDTRAVWIGSAVAGLYSSGSGGAG